MNLAFDHDPHFDAVEERDDEERGDKNHDDHDDCDDHHDGVRRIYQRRIYLLVNPPLVYSPGFGHHHVGYGLVIMTPTEMLLMMMILV